MPDPLLLITVFTIFGLIGAQLGKRIGGRPEAWFIWGFVLGPIGWPAAFAAQRISGQRQS